MNLVRVANSSLLAFTGRRRSRRVPAVGSYNPSDNQQTGVRTDGVAAGHDFSPLYCGARFVGLPPLGSWFIHACTDPAEPIVAHAPCPASKRRRREHLVVSSSAVSVFPPRPRLVHRITLVGPTSMTVPIGIARLFRASAATGP